jgi:putative FmdB family regulatory protein
MSTYEYECKDCGQKFEKTLSMAEHDKLHPACPKCKSKHVEQMFSVFSAKTSSKT